MATYYWQAVPFLARAIRDLAMLGPDRLGVPGEDATAPVAYSERLYTAPGTAEMARRGYHAVVYTSRHGYDDPTHAYPARELLDGVEVRRLPFSSFGKDSIKIRLLAQIVFLLQAMVHALFTRRLCGLMVSTSPPACGIGGAIVSLLRRVPVKFWVMDINPDQLVVMKVLSAKSWPVKLFDAFNWAILRRASHIIALDRFMADRVAAKHSGLTPKICVLPLWPLVDQVHDIPHLANPFRQKHVRPAQGPPQPQQPQPIADERFVLMYSGLHTAANPLRTVLDAAQRVHSTHPQLLLMSIGGGSGKRDVEDRVAADGDAIAQAQPFQARAKLRVRSVIGVDDDARHRETGLTHGADVGERHAPLLAKGLRRGNARRRPPIRIARPRRGQIQLEGQRPDAAVRDQGTRHGDLTIADLAERATILPLHADRVRPLLRKSRIVDDPRRDRAVRLDFRYHVLANPGHHGVVRPFALADEMQQRLMLSRRPIRCRHGRHRLHALAIGRHEQTGAIARHCSVPARIAEAAGEIIDVRSKAFGASAAGVLIHVRSRS